MTSIKCFRRGPFAPAMGLFALLLATVLACPSALAQVPVPSLFAQAAPGMQADRAITRDPQVRRARTVVINTALLTGMGDAPGGFFPGGNAILLNLFDEASVVALPSRVERSGRDVVWVASLRDQPLGQALLVISGDIVSGNITLPGARYHIRYVGNGLHETQEIDESKFPADEPETPIPSASAFEAPRAKELMLDDGSQIDLMVAYTATTRAAAGGSTAIQNLIALAIAETNQSYANSGVLQRLRLVHTEEVNYTESGNISTDLSRVTSTSDGYIDQVHSLRNTHGADLVSLWVENGGGYCGIAWLMTSVSTGFAPNGFSVVARNCATGYYSFGHELGHNMGLRHDMYVDTGTTPYAYAHGYTRPTATPPWRTIMAYNNACSGVGGCTRIQYWSNPSVSYGGVAMGDANADNQQALDNTAYAVANFRAAAVTVPGAPSIGSATAGNSSGSVSFSPPASNGGAAIDNYRVTCSPGGATALGTASPISVSGLANGASHTCTVAAHNSAGWGPESSASNAFTPLAQVQRAFVSALAGNDVHVATSCALGAPCRTFAGALPVVSAGGEIVAIDSGEFGVVSLDKSLSLIGAPGEQVSITVSSGNGVTVSGSGTRVNLRNLSIVGAGGSNGVSMTSGDALSVEQSVVSGFGSGSGIVVSSVAAVRVADTLVRNCLRGANLINGPSVSISRSRFLANSGNGILIGGNAASTTRAAISQTVVSGTGADWGISAQSLVSGANVAVQVTRSTISGSDRGVVAVSNAGSPSTLTLNRSRVSSNAIGLYQSGAGAALRSRGNNALADNASNSAGSISPLPGQ